MSHLGLTVKNYEPASLASLQMQACQDMSQVMQFAALEKSETRGLRLCKSQAHTCAKMASITPSLLRASTDGPNRWISSCITPNSLTQHDKSNAVQNGRLKSFKRVTCSVSQSLEETQKATEHAESYRTRAAQCQVTAQVHAAIQV